MTYLKLSLLSFSLATLVVGCSQNTNDSDPLIPEIKAIQITGYADKTTIIHSLNQELQLTATIIYTNDENSTSTSQLDWDSNDSNIITSSIIVHNGLCAATKNSGAELISASYRDKIFTKDDEQKLITIDPLMTVDITEQDIIIKKLDAVVGGTYQLSTKGNFKSTDTIENISSNIVWTSSDNNISTVSSTGTIYPINVGTIKINVSVYNEINASIELKVQ